MEALSTVDVDWLLAQLYGFAVWLWAFWQTKFILGHIALNVVVAVAASIYIGEFLLGELGKFLYRKVLPYLLVFGAFALMGEAAQMPAMADVAFAGLEALLLASLFDNIKKIGLKAMDNRPEGGPMPIVARIPKAWTKE